MLGLPPFSFFFFFNDTATTEIYTLSLHDALPISWPHRIAFAPDLRRHLDPGGARIHPAGRAPADQRQECQEDRKSTRLNSSHGYISYAVFCLKKKNKNMHDLDHHRATTYVHTHRT